MKTFVKLFGVVAGMAALLISCNKQENLPVPEAKTVEMTIHASSDATKTVLGADGAVTWSTTTGEKLAVIEQSYVGEEATVAKATSKDGVTSDKGATMSFEVSLPTKNADSYNYYAVYPNSAYVSNSNTNVEKFKVELVSTQTPTATSFGPEADILVSKAVSGETAQPKELKLQFARVIAVGKMTIKNLNTTENVKKVTFTATGKPVTGRSHINLTNATAIAYGYADQGVDNVVLDYSGKEISADGMTAYFTCWPFSIAAGETFSVVVETENYTFTKDVILGEGKSLAFNEGCASAFNVSFTDIDGVEKAPATQLVPNGEYVIAYDTNMMTVGTTSNKYRDVATLPKAANADGSYSVDASAAWNFVYDSETDTYLINSVEDNTLYLQGSSTGSDFKLVAKESATSFTITKDEVAGTYRIANTRCIGYNYNNGSPRFAMYSTTATAQYIDLKLYTAKVVALPKIDVQNILEVSSAKTTASFPVTFTNGSASKVNVYKDADCTIPEEGWITVAFNATKTEIDYVVSENTGDPRTAYIKVYALGEDGESEATAVVTVTQAAKGSGTEQSWTWTAASGDLGTAASYSATLNGKAWEVTRSSVIYTGYSSSCIQLGSKSGAETVTLSSNAFAGTIKKVDVECASYNGAHTVDITVGGVSYVSGASTSSWATVETISGAGSSSGKIVITFTAGSRALYIKSITVTYDASGSSTPVQLTAPVVSCSEQTANSLTFKWEAVANATGYQVSTDGGVNYGDTQNETTYTWSGLSEKTTYTLYVKAVGDGTSYTNSDAASAEGTTTASSGGGTHVVLYTLDTTGTLQGSNNSYAGNCDIESDGIIWNVTGNTNINPWRIGGKSLTGVDREVYSRTAFDKALTSIDVTFGTTSGITVNSCKIVYSTSADFSNSQEVTGTFAASSTVKFEAEYPANCYYKLVLNVSVSSSKNNGYVQLSKIEFIGNN